MEPSAHQKLTLNYLAAKEWRSIMKQNYKMTLCYDGTRYYGWEHQPGRDTVQGKIESVLCRMCGVPEGSIEVTGAGRTDAGVHARGMVANAVLDTSMSESDIRAYMNAYLPDDISVQELKAASDRFHARYQATGKAYCYTCYYGDTKPVFNRKYVYTLEKSVDIGAMNEAAGYLIGEHDFKSFCGNPKMKKSTVRTVDDISIKQKNGYIYFNFHGTGFLQHMVRIITGTLLEVGEGLRTPASMKEILDAGDRLAAGKTAPAKGLCLIKVDYQ